MERFILIAKTHIDPEIFPDDVERNARSLPQAMDDHLKTLSRNLSLYPGSKMHMTVPENSFARVFLHECAKRLGWELPERIFDPRSRVSNVSSELTACIVIANLDFRQNDLLHAISAQLPALMSQVPGSFLSMYSAQSPLRLVKTDRGDFVEEYHDWSISSPVSPQFRRSQQDRNRDIWAFSSSP